ncbi:MAG: G5 domain-containing protein [Clostridia bacterium]|nr:G5 domain-containing protein [Clostridia bacterium]
MSFKEKIKKEIQLTKAITVIAIVSLICIISIVVLISKKIQKTTYAYSISEETNEIVSNLNSDIDILNIIKENTSTKYYEEYAVEVKDLEYLTTYEDNPELPKGMVQVLQEGRDGSQKVTSKKMYTNGELTGEEEISNQIIKAPINKIVAVGTGIYKSNYTVKVGDKLYVTPDTLGLLIEPDQLAEVVLIIYKDSEVELLEILDEWYKISYGIYTGYCPANCLTYLKPHSQLNEDQGEEGFLSKEQLIARLSFDMDLTKPSGLTLDQFKQVLSNNSRDKNKIFEDNSEYFYYIEKQYNVNGIFVAAVGIHESGWGTSSICVNKKNLFGYGAYDSNPYGNAYSYSSYAESIDLIARVFAKYYLNPAGTNIYDGQIASGTYYHGATLSGVNTKYATDKNWANAVYTWMSYLYNNL